MQVTKRDGRIVQFNKDKIIQALQKAFIEIDKEITEDSKQKIEQIAQSIEKENENKEYRAYDVTKHGSHVVEHLGKRNEHKSGSLVQALDAWIADDGGNYHKSCQERNSHIEELDLMDGGLKTYIFFHVRAVGYHDTHCYWHWVEKLSHSRNDGHDAEVREVRLDIIEDTVPISVYCICNANECRDTYWENEQDRHHYLADLFDTLFNTKKDNERGHAYKNSEKQQWLPRASDKALKISVSRGGACTAGGEHGKVFKNPTADNGIIG